MTVVTGVSGSGKSTLVNDILYRALAKALYRSREEAGAHKAITGTEYIDKVIRIDQSPIGRTPRSNPATYTGVFTQIRDLYAMLPESRERGYKAGRFSFNVAGGRCEACQGEGQRRIEMNFLPDVYVLCEVCGGKRYNHETLAVKYKGYSIADLLETPVADALPMLENIPQIKQKLQTLVDVGLGYIHLGQSAVTLSGGEAQRIKLARELSKRQTGKTLYLLDEPTTGLHFDDVSKLLEVLHRLTDLGNSIIIIEHNMDVIRNADWIIDLGPEGGEEGGRIVAQGTPEQVARVKKSYTGQTLSQTACRERPIAKTARRVRLSKQVAEWLNADNSVWPIRRCHAEPCPAHRSRCARRQPRAAPELSSMCPAAAEAISLPGRAGMLLAVLVFTLCCAIFVFSLIALFIAHSLPQLPARLLRRAGHERRWLLSARRAAAYPVVIVVHGAARAPPQQRSLSGKAIRWNWPGSTALWFYLLGDRAGASRSKAWHTSCRSPSRCPWTSSSTMPPAPT